MSLIAIMMGCIASQGSVVAAPNEGLFFGNSSTATWLYIFGTDVISAGSALATSKGSGSRGASNSTVAIVNTSRATAGNKYTYTGNVSAAGTALGGTGFEQGACGNATIGYFERSTGVVDKYTYAGDSVSTGSTLSSAPTDTSACGNTTKGIFAGGFSGGVINTTAMYTYSGDAVAAGGNLNTAREDAGAASSATVGIYAFGYDGSSAMSSSAKYTFSSDTCAAGTAMAGGARYFIGGASNTTVGVFGYGTATAVSTTDKYTYSGDTVAAGTSFGFTPDAGNAVSNCHGGL